MLMYPACSGSRSAWRPASFAVARKKSGWIDPNETNEIANANSRESLQLKNLSWNLNGYCFTQLSVLNRPADPEAGERWSYHQKTRDCSFPCPLPQKHSGTSQGTSHGLWWVSTLLHLSLNRYVSTCCPFAKQLHE